MQEDLKRSVESHNSRLVCHLVPVSGPGRKDFHDRRISFIPDRAKPQRRVTVLLTGGIDRYMSPKFECSIIVHCCT